MAHRLLFRLFVGPRGRGGRTSSSVALLEESAGWLDVVCSGSLSSRPGGAVRDVRDRRSNETADGACRRGAEQIVTICGVGLRRGGRWHEEPALIAQVQREVDEAARDEASDRDASNDNRI